MWLGMGISLLGGAGFFVSMACFHLFGTVVTLSLETLVSFSFLILAMAGVGSIYGGIKGATNWAVFWTFLLIAAGFIGYLTKGLSPQIRQSIPAVIMVGVVVGIYIWNYVHRN